MMTGIKGNFGLIELPQVQERAELEDQRETPSPTCDKISVQKTLMSTFEPKRSAHRSLITNEEKLNNNETHDVAVFDQMN